MLKKIQVDHSVLLIEQISSEIALQSVRGQSVRDSGHCSTTLMSEHAKGYNLSCSTKWISVVPEQVVINLQCANKERPTTAVVQLQMVKTKGINWLYSFFISC